MVTLELPRIFAPSSHAHLLKATCQNAKLQEYPWLLELCRTMSDPLLILNEDRRVIKANRILLNLFQLTGESQVLGTILDIKDSQDFRLREELVQVDGEDYWLVVIADTRDEVRRRTLERVFLHDILNTAGGMQGLSEVMVDAAPDDMTFLKDTVKHLADQLVDEIIAQRDFLAAENGDLVVSPIAVYAADIADLVAKRYCDHPAAENRQVVQVGAVEPIVFRTDPTLLGRILGNMIKNALEASPDESVVTIDYGFKPGPVPADPRRSGQVWFSVHNAGHIPTEIQSRIFTRLFSTKGAGRGLGTYGMRLLCEGFLAGRVEFQSHPTDGTVFTVTLPFDVPCR